jgi:menaquinone-9 beta-reductase
MLRKHNYDVIVVGCGPAGATVSYLLQLQGFKVLAIDKDTFPRLKLCGGLLTYKTINLLHRVYGDTLATLQDKKIIEYTSYFYELRAQQVVLKSGETNLPAVLVDRLIYDNYLLEQAKSVGVEVLEGDRVFSVDSNNSCVTTVGGEILQANIIIGADGANSIVRKSIPAKQFNSKHWEKNLAVGVEVSIPREEVSDLITGPVVYFGLVPWGYGWVFPNKEKLIVGVGCLEPRNNNLKAELDKVLSLIGYKPKSVYKLRGHPIPYGNFLQKPAYRSILLLGDAAGLVDPLMGEGIYYAQRSAEIAAKCVKECTGIGVKNILASRYTKALQESIISELVAINKFRWFIFTMSDLFSPGAIKLIVDIIGVQRFSELVHGVRSYRWLKQGGIDENF